MVTGVGVIGLGMAVTPHMLALQDLAAAGRVRIVGGHAPSAARRDAFAACWSAPVFGTLDALLAAPGLDLALVLAPPGAHLPIAETVAAAGKHMIVEKPLERTVARAEALATLAERAGVRASVCFQHRFRPGALEFARRLHAGELGTPLSASASIRWWRDANYFAQPGRGTMARDGGGVLLTQAIHTMDLLLHLMGPVGEVTGFAPDVTVPADMRAGVVTEDPDMRSKVIERLGALPQPVIAGVHGHCYTGGLELALAADLIVAAQDAMFRDTHAMLGIVPRWGLSARLPRRIGLAAAKKMSWMSMPLDASSAMNIGLCDYVVPGAELVSFATDIAKTLAQKSALAVTSIKRLYAKGLECSLAEALANERAATTGVYRHLQSNT